MKSSVSLEDVVPCFIALDTFFVELLSSLSGSPDLVVGIERQLRASGELIFKNGTNAWRAMPIRPSRSSQAEGKAFAGLVLVIQSIIREVSLGKNFGPELVFQVAPILNMNPQDDGDPNVSWWPEMATLSNLKAGVPCWEQVILSCEFKETDWDEDVDDNARKILSNMTYVMDSDPRRRFTFGITAEDTTMRIWFCSRSTVAVTQPFDYFEKPDCLIRLIASLACATETQRGFDPTMRLVQGWEQVRRMYDIDVYTDPDSPPTTYRSRTLLSDFGAHSLRGRATRVFEVQLLVDGEPTGESHALKDVWVDFDCATEGELLDEIEASIGEETFKRYFMTKLQHGYVYIPNVAGTPVIDRTFMPTTAVDVGDQCRSDFTLGFSKLQGLKSVSTGRVLDSSQPLKRNVFPSDKYKYHYRIVFEDVGTPVNQLTSVKIMFKVLADIITALEILHRAGWMHCNLRPSSIYAHNGNGKLSDLEYAKKHTDDSRHEVRPNTAQFMAVEVEHGIFSYGSAPFQSNGLHDIESSLWIAIWMIFFSTASVLDEPSASGINTSNQVEAAYKVVYHDRARTLLEDSATLTVRFHNLDSSVMFILPLLVNARDSLAHHQRIVGKALGAGKVTTQTIYPLCTSVYNDVRVAFQQISDEAPHELYLHFITTDSS